MRFLLALAAALAICAQALAQPGSPYLSYGWPHSAGGSPTYNNAVGVQVTSGTATSATTGSFATVANASYVVFATANDGTSVLTPTSVQIDGSISLTQNGTTGSCVSGGNNIGISVWQTTAAVASGSHTVTVTYASAPGYDIDVTVVSVTGATAGGPIHTLGTFVCAGTSTPTGESTTVTSASGELVVDGVFLNNGSGASMSPSSPQTLAVENGTTGTQAGSSYQAGAAGTVTSTWSGWNGSAPWAGYSVSLH